MTPIHDEAVGEDRLSLTEVLHRDHLARRRDIALRLHGIEDALAGHFARIAPEQQQEAQTFLPVLTSWRQTRARRVLVIDDDTILSRILVRSLVTLGFAAEAVADGEEGLTRARAAAYDLLIVDLNMPALPGMRVVEELRRWSARRNAPILIISGVAAQEDLDAVALDCGATAALSKPFTVDEFEAAVRRLLAPTVADMALAAPVDERESAG